MQAPMVHIAKDPSRKATLGILGIGTLAVKPCETLVLRSRVTPKKIRVLFPRQIDSSLTRSYVGNGDSQRVKWEIRAQVRVFYHHFTHLHQR